MTTTAVSSKKRRYCSRALATASRAGAGSVFPEGALPSSVRLFGETGRGPTLTGVWRFPAPAWRQGISGRRYWLGHGGTHRPPSRRPGMGGGRGEHQRHILFHTLRDPLI